MVELRKAVAVVFQDRLFLAARIMAAMGHACLHVGTVPHKSLVNELHRGNGKRHRP